MQANADPSRNFAADWPIPASGEEGVSIGPSPRSHGMSQALRGAPEVGSSDGSAPLGGPQSPADAPLAREGVLVRIGHKFLPRRSEWIAAVQLMLWGIVFLLPGQLFGRPAFEGFTGSGLSENSIGVVFFLFGLARFIGLVINGAMVKTTSVIRVISASLGFPIWIYVSYCFASAFPWWEWSTWLAAWPVAAVAEYLNIRAAIYDARIAYHGRHTE